MLLKILSGTLMIKLTYQSSTKQKNYIVHLDYKTGKEIDYSLYDAALLLLAITAVRSSVHIDSFLLFLSGLIQWEIYIG